MMRILFLSLAFTASALGADVHEVPVHIFYQKLGNESRDIAESKGKREIESGNPCVLKMMKEAEAWANGPALRAATDVVLLEFPGDRKPRPHLGLQFRNDSIELQYELRSLPERGPDGWIVHPEKTVYRKGVIISNKNGDWKERLNKGKCQITDKNTTALLDELNEADWLRSCQKRKLELLEASRKINNYVHTYLPPVWIEEAKARLGEQDVQIGTILRDNVAVYREGNDTSRNCLKGLELLEREAADTVTVLNEIKSAKNDKVVLPNAEVTELASRLQGPADTDRMPASIRKRRK